MYQQPYLAYLKRFHLLDETFNTLYSLSIFNQVLLYHNHFVKLVVLFMDKVSRGLVPTLYVVWHVVFITCHTTLRQAVMCGKALIMAPVQI
jgi:hypothetical protein